MRLNKYIAQSGFCSRRRADKLIEEGLVLINGHTASLGDPVTDKDTVSVDGTVIDGTQQQDLFLAFHKPFGVICTADKNADNTVYDYLPDDQRLLYIGRLDVESSGLLLFTNNGEVANAIAHGSGDHEKEYVVTVDKPYTRRFVDQMKSGVLLDDEMTKPARLKKLGAKKFSLVITQGRNRQIRRMCEALGYQVTSLKRVRVMNVKLGMLGAGNSRPLTKKERRELLAQLTTRPYGNR